MSKTGAQAPVDGVLGYHLNPLTCGVAKFNVMLARRLDVPMFGLFDGRTATLGHPLLSLKLSEFSDNDMSALASMVETVSWRRHFSLFLHAWSDTPVEQLLLSRAATVHCGNAELVAQLEPVVVPESFAVGIAEQKSERFADPRAEQLAVVEPLAFSIAVTFD